MTRTNSTPFFDRAISWSLDHPFSPPVTYLLATGSVLLVALIRALLITSLVPWLLFVPVILIVALMLGEAAGFYAAVISAILAAVSIGSTTSPFFLTGPQWAGSLLFLVTTAGIVRVGGEVRAAFRRARQANAALAERQGFLSSVLASSTDCIKVLGLDGRLSFISEGGLKVMEISDFNLVNGCPWPDFWEGEGNAEARTAIEKARAGKTSHFTAKADTFLGNPRWWDVSVSPILGEDGNPIQILSVSRDTTDLLEAREQQALLNGELGHRLKNVLSMVQAIANQTFRQGGSLDEVNATLASRFSALGKATDLLTSTSWQSATLHDVIRASIVSTDGMADRVRASGPEIKLDAQVALALSLALHELTTNACKYGALSNDDGEVSITWDHRTVENEGDGRFTFLWQETGGPRVDPPTRQGFGSRLIERSLRSYFRGETSLDYAPEGVSFKIVAPLPASAVKSEG